jgi:predicted RNA-binding Zn-ribbon protein involved in translation (DUF1610 family)
MAKKYKNKKSHKESAPVSHSQPYDSKVFEQCPACEEKMFYRKRKLFNQTIYYLLCNQCGEYKTITKDEYLEKVSAATQPK